MPTYLVSLYTALSRAKPFEKPAPHKYTTPPPPSCHASWSPREIRSGRRHSRGGPVDASSLARRGPTLLRRAATPIARHAACTSHSPSPQLSCLSVRATALCTLFLPPHERRACIFMGAGGIIQADLMPAGPRLHKYIINF